MNNYSIVANVGIGTPSDEEIIFNIHISVANLDWSISFSYGQLCQLDNLINESCNKIKHISFPVISSTRQQRVVQALAIGSSYSSSSDTTKLMVEKLRQLMEIWIHAVIMRMHAFPIEIQTKIQKLMYLPSGPPYSDRETIEILPDNQQSIGRKSVSFFRSKVDDEETYSKLCIKEAELESTSLSLLRVSVRRGAEGPRGKQEFVISITHSNNRSDPPFDVCRRFSEFAQLNLHLRNNEPADLLFAPFPIPPSKCALGLSLDEVEMSIRTRHLDSWLRDVLYNFRVLSSSSRAKLRTFLKLVALSSEETYTDTAAAGLPSTNKSVASPTRGAMSEATSSSPAGSSSLAISLQTRLSAGLVEGARAENYAHVMQASQKLRSKLKEAAAAAGGSAVIEDDAVSEDSRMEEAVPVASTLAMMAKKRRQSIIGNMWEVASSASRLPKGSPAGATGTSAGPDADTTGAAKVSSAGEIRVNRYQVVNAIICGESPFKEELKGDDDEEEDVASPPPSSSFTGSTGAVTVAAKLQRDSLALLGINVFSMATSSGSSDKCYLSHRDYQPDTLD